MRRTSPATPARSSQTDVAGQRRCRSRPRTATLPRPCSRARRHEGRRSARRHDPARRFGDAERGRRRSAAARPDSSSSSSTADSAPAGRRPTIASQVEADVEHLRRVRQLADGDVVDAGLADARGPISRVRPPLASSITARPHLVAHRDRRAHRLGLEVVEQHDVGAGVDRLARDRRSSRPRSRPGSSPPARAPRRTPRRPHRRRATWLSLTSAASTERHAVVGATAAAHGVLLERAQPGRRLARVAHRRAACRRARRPSAGSAWRRRDRWQSRFSAVRSAVSSSRVGAVDRGRRRVPGVDALAVGDEVARSRSPSGPHTVSITAAATGRPATTPSAAGAERRRCCAGRPARWPSTSRRCRRRGPRRSPCGRARRRRRGRARRRSSGAGCRRPSGWNVHTSASARASPTGTPATRATDAVDVEARRRDGAATRRAGSGWSVRRWQPRLSVRAGAAATTADADRQQVRRLPRCARAVHRRRGSCRRRRRARSPPRRARPSVGAARRRGATSSSGRRRGARPSSTPRRPRRRARGSTRVGELPREVAADPRAGDDALGQAVATPAGWRRARRCTRPRRRRTARASRCGRRGRRGRRRTRSARRERPGCGRGRVDADLAARRGDRREARRRSARPCASRRGRRGRRRRPAPRPCAG